MERNSNFGVLALQFSGELVLIMPPGESTIKTISWSWMPFKFSLVP